MRRHKESDGEITAETPDPGTGHARSIRTTGWLNFIIYGKRSGCGKPACPSCSDRRWREEVAGLLRVQCRLLRKLGRLQKAERDLFMRVQRSRRRDGRTAIRQIERERRRLGRELHTGVGQMLAAMRLQLEFISAQLPSPPPVVGQALGRLLTLAQEALQEVRGISKSLASPGMAAALPRVRPAATLGPQRDRRAVPGRTCVSNRCRTSRI